MDDDDNEDLDLSRGKQTMMVLSLATFFVLFVFMMVANVLPPETTFSLGHRGSLSRVPLTREQGLTIFLSLVVLLALVVVLGIWRSLRTIWGGAKPDAVPRKLRLDETVLWIGRPGWRSFRGGRVVGAFFAILLPALFLWWMASALRGPGTINERLFWMMIPAGLFLVSVLPIMIGVSDSMHAWLSDAFGYVAVTRKRIVWLRPFSRKIYRQISRGGIVDAFLTASNGRRGSVTIVKQRKDDVEHVYIDGLPEPEKAYAAIQALINYTTRDAA